jgi:hypothetical protein
VEKKRAANGRLDIAALLNKPNRFNLSISSFWLLRLNWMRKCSNYKVNFKLERIKNHLTLKQSMFFIFVYMLLFYLSS